jgi:hypothetical protein
MAVSYAICNVQRFENRDNYRVPSQGILCGVEIPPESYYMIKDPSYCTFTINNTACSIANYEAFQDVKQNKHGRIADRTFTWYLEPHQFNIYHIATHNLLIIAAGKKTVESFIGQMESDKNSGLLCKRIEIDFKKIQSLIPIISGAWFDELQRARPYIAAAGYFGNHVDKSEEFKSASEAGVISALSLPYNFKGRDIKISITKNGTIVLYNRFTNQITKAPDIPSELELVINVYHQYIK